MLSGNLIGFVYYLVHLAHFLSEIENISEFLCIKKHPLWDALVLVVAEVW